MNPSSRFAEWLSSKRIGIALRLQTKRVILVSSGAAGLVVSDCEDISTVEAEPLPRDVFPRGGETSLFVSPQFSCIAKSSDGVEICPVWKPFFISEIKMEDRCHLNGMAVRDGKPGYVTAFAETDTKAGWRQKRDAGIVIDVERNEIVCRGLSMPHSPRIHDGKLWVLNSGAGEVGVVEAGRFHPVARCPGFLRGLAFVGDHALIGSSMPRNPFFAGLPMHTRVRAASRCGIYVLNIQTGEMEHSLHFNNVVEMYEIAVTQ